MTNSRLSELQQFRSLSEKVNQTYRDMLCGTSQSNSRLEEVIVKIIDLSHEINADIDRLEDMTYEARKRFEALENPENRMFAFAVFVWEDV